MDIHTKLLLSLLFHSDSRYPFWTHVTISPLCATARSIYTPCSPSCRLLLSLLYLPYKQAGIPQGFPISRSPKPFACVCSAVKPRLHHSDCVCLLACLFTPQIKLVQGWDCPSRSGKYCLCSNQHWNNGAGNSPKTTEIRSHKSSWEFSPRSSSQKLLCHGQTDLTFE